MRVPNTCFETRDDGRSPSTRLRTAELARSISASVFLHPTRRRHRLRAKRACDRRYVVRRLDCKPDRPTLARAFRDRSVPRASASARVRETPAQDCHEGGRVPRGAEDVLAGANDSLARFVGSGVKPGPARVLALRRHARGLVKAGAQPIDSLSALVLESRDAKRAPPPSGPGKRPAAAAGGSHELARPRAGAHSRRPDKRRSACGA
jgi:hypothetical protein